MSRIKLFIFGVCTLLFIQTQLSFAATATPILIQNFIAAVNAKDKQKIDLAMDELRVNAEAQEILKKQWPDYFILFNYYRMALEVKELKSSYGSTTSRTIIPETPSSGEKTGNSTNRDRAFIKATPNRILSRQSPGPDNSEAARNYPNQDRESNQDRIQRRR